MTEQVINQTFFETEFGLRIFNKLLLLIPEDASKSIKSAKETDYFIIAHERESGVFPRGLNIREAIATEML